MKVQITEYLRGELTRAGTDPDTFIENFADWKGAGPDGEFNHYYFGKDAEYSRPQVNGKRVLRHVHLVPMDDSPRLAEWDRDWRKYRRRSSDTALVYADAGRFGFLLIAILWEPDAHRVAEMRDQISRDTMNGFATVADYFIFDGSIVI
ncbi:type II toxin-antitoxin system YafO family toxin [Massilia sp. CCM 8734]|uniref:type II toxin-antitoxin system YafO family toxin n=1 Tax=Massilia sp. CCM 8734 TaxID=2609283 RepID=UPI001423E404|nr:type II toxin-antitoxin system YafO family toxin [Massilia sp. CCM 8734]NHZ97468.1 hypothetical protein [Massilia sp. CCM 8734]